MALACNRLPVRSGVLLVVLTALLAATGLSGAETVETAQRAVAEWAKLRLESVRLAEDWRMQRESLDAMLVALKARIEGLKAERDSVASAVKIATSQSSETAASNEESRATLATVEERMKTLTARMVQLRAFLPPRLSEGLDLAYTSIEDPKLGAAERMQHVITIFNRCGAFNKAITYTEQELSLDGSGDSRLLEVMYFGLSHAYAYDRTNRTAYLGHPGATGWVWDAQPAAAEAVAQMIEIHHERSDPVYVVLPGQISDANFASQPQAR